MKKIINFILNKSNHTGPFQVHVYEGGVWTSETVDESALPAGATPRRVGDTWVYPLERVVGPQAAAGPVPTSTPARLAPLPNDINITPDDLYQGRNWPEVPIMMRLEATMLEKLRTGIMMAYLGGLGFLVIILVAMVMED